MLLYLCHNVNPYFQGTGVVSWLQHRRYTNALANGFKRDYWQSSLKIDLSKPGTERTKPYYEKIDATLLSVTPPLNDSEIPDIYVHNFFRDIKEGVKLFARQFAREYYQEQAVESVEDVDTLEFVLVSGGMFPALSTGQIYTVLEPTGNWMLRALKDVNKPLVVPISAELKE